MIDLIRRALITALTPPAEPVREQPIRVRAHTRKRPVNAKREALHEQLRAELGR